MKNIKTSYESCSTNELYEIIKNLKEIIIGLKNTNETFSKRSQHFEYGYKLLGHELAIRGYPVPIHDYIDDKYNVNITIKKEIAEYKKINHIVKNINSSHKDDMKKELC